MILVKMRLGGCPLYLARRRWVGSVAFRTSRMPLLEELTEPLVLRQDLSNAGAGANASLKNYIPPTTTRQIEASLSHEFDRHIVKTDWSTYSDPVVDAECEQAARLLQYTLAAMHDATAKANTDATLPPEDVGWDADTWIRAECEVLLAEIESGSTERWEDAERLVGEQWPSMSAEQQKALRPAVLLVGKNPHFHPRVKTAILQEIRSVITATIK